MLSLKTSSCINNAHKEYCLRVALHPNWSIFASGGSLEDCLLRIWSIDSGKCLASTKSSGEINGI